MKEDIVKQNCPVVAPFQAHEIQFQDAEFQKQLKAHQKQMGFENSRNSQEYDEIHRTSQTEMLNSEYIKFDLRNAMTADDQHSPYRGFKGSNIIKARDKFGTV